MKKKTIHGQASVEQLFIVSLGILMTATLFYFAFNYSSDNAKVSQARDAVDRIGAAADYVYSLSPGTMESVEVNVPDSVQNISVANQSFRIQVQTSTGPSDFVSSSNAKLILGYFPPGTGKQQVQVKYLGYGYVIIGNAGLNCSPDFISETFNLSQNYHETINISNIGPSNITGLNSTLTPPLNQTNITPFWANLTNANLTFNSTIIANFTFNSPSNGTFSGLYFVQSSMGNCAVPIELTFENSSIPSQVCNLWCNATNSMQFVDWSCWGSATSCIAHGYVDVGSAKPCKPSPKKEKQECCCLFDKQGPLVTNLSTNVSKINITTPVTLVATCDDSQTGGQNISGAAFQLNGGAWTSLQPPTSQGATVLVNYSAGNFPAGWNIASARCTDIHGNIGPAATLLFNVTLT